MKQTLEDLLKQINIAHKQSDHLRRKLGYRGLKNYKLSKDNIYEIEVKLTPEEYESHKGQILHLSDIDLENRQWAYFYNRKETDLFTAEKIYNGSLKEYYVGITDTLFLNYHTDDDCVPRFETRGQALVSILNRMLSFSNVLTGFQIYNTYFYPNYVSVDVKTNKPDAIYFYSTPEEGYTSFFVNEPCSYEIIRVDLASFKVSQIYSQSLLNDSLSIFKYFKPCSLKEPYVVLESIVVD